MRSTYDISHLITVCLLYFSKLHINQNKTAENIFINVENHSLAYRDIPVFLTEIKEIVTLTSLSEYDSYQCYLSPHSI